MDRDTRQIIGANIGSRCRHGAQQLWDSLPYQYRYSAIVYTDLWPAYQEVIPKHLHHPVAKETGETNHIERFNCTIRQRVARLNRKTLALSKSLTNHIAVIWNFIHYYNENLITT